LLGRLDGRLREGAFSEESPQLRIVCGLRFDVGEEGVHFPRHTILVLHPEFIGLSEAAGHTLLLNAVDALSLGPRHLGGHLSTSRIADAEMTELARFAANDEREDDRRISDLELGIARADFRGLDAEDLAVAIEGGVEIPDVHRNVKRVCHGSLPSW